MEVFRLFIYKLNLKVTNIKVHEGCQVTRRERAKFDRIVKMKTVRMTVITAFSFVICQVNKIQYWQYQVGQKKYVCCID